jgi:hypothetical protein
MAQQVLFAQQPILQAFWLGAFERMQDAAGKRSGVTAIASTTVIRIATLFRITLFVAHESPRVDHERSTGSR